MKMEKILAYLSIIFVIFLATGSSDFSNDKNVITGGWFLFLCIYLYKVRMIEYFFLIIIGIFVVISGIFYLQNGAYNEVTYLGLFMKVTLAYFCRELCEENFVKYYINIVFVLACISLPLYFIQLINFDFIYNLNNLFGPKDSLVSLSSSIIFVTVPLHDIRNCGFMWEPGAYAAVLLLTLYINIFREGENFKSRKNIVFIFALLTTQSTMGFLSLCIPVWLIMMETLSQNKTFQKFSVFIFPSIIGLFFILFTSVDFLYEKMMKEISGVDEELEMIEGIIHDDYKMSATRLASIIIDSKSIAQYPILGLGVDNQTTGESKLAFGTMAITACGLTALMLRFGIVGFLAYFYLFYKQALFEEKAHRIGWVVLVFFILFSNELSATSFIHLFLF
jgi:hypothetical protein